MTHNQSNKRKITYEMVSEKTAEEIQKKKQEYLNKIKSIPLPSVKLHCYRSADLFSLLRPINEIYADYQQEMIKKKQAKREAQYHLKNNGPSLR